MLKTALVFTKAVFAFLWPTILGFFYMTMTELENFLFRLRHGLFVLWILRRRGGNLPPVSCGRDLRWRAAGSRPYFTHRVA